MKKVKITSTAYAVFIIESLRQDEFRDGERLSKILEMAGIHTLYRWVSCIEELRQAILEFHKSGYRYLHLSCHSDFDGLEIGGDEVSNFELLKILKGKIAGRRLFFSSCKGGNLYSATIAIEKCKGQSVVGTPVDIYFHEAALFWPSFYYVINRIDREKMNRKSMTESIQRCVDLFNVQINYYYKSKKSGYINRDKFKSKRLAVHRLVKAAKNI